MGTDGYSDGSDDNNREIDNDNSVEVSYSLELKLNLNNYSAERWPIY